MIACIQKQAALNSTWGIWAEIMQHNKQSENAAKAISEIRSLKERVIRTGVDETATFVSLIDALGAAEAAFTRWYAEAASQDSTAELEESEK